MSIKIEIERRFKEPVVPEILQILDEIRIKALRVRGYIGGETAINVDDDREVLVFSSWSSAEDWTQWYATEEWKDLEKKLAPHLADPVKVRVFVPAADYEKKAFLENSTISK